MRIRDPGWRLFGSGMEKSRIRDKHPGCATLGMSYYYRTGSTYRTKQLRMWHFYPAKHPIGSLTYCFIHTSCKCRQKHLIGLLRSASTICKSTHNYEYFKCCGSEMFIPDTGSKFFHPGSRVKKIPDPGSGSKNLGIFTQKIVSKLSDPDLDFLPILDRGVRGQLNIFYLLQTREK
jgi:hypothetical protein